jgi:hypothetical protein
MCVLPLSPGNPQPGIPASASSSVKLTPGRTGKGGHRTYTYIHSPYHIGLYEDRVFPIKLGAAYLKKIKYELRKKYFRGST